MEIIATFWHNYEDGGTLRRSSFLLGAQGMALTVDKYQEQSPGSQTRSTAEGEIFVTEATLKIKFKSWQKEER